MRKKTFITVFLFIGFYAASSQISFDPLADFFRTTQATPVVELSTQKDIYVAYYGNVFNDGCNDIRKAYLI